MNLNTEQVQWSQRYQVALGEYTKQTRGENLDAAVTLGRRAVELELETLDVARMHEQCMLLLTEKTGPLKAAVLVRAKNFFLETLVPVERTHPSVQETERRVKAVTEALRVRTKEFSAASHRLDRGIAKRKAAETALKESGRGLSGLLRESSQLQSRLRHKTQDKLLSHEGVSQYESHQLRNEIAQTLLAIQLRLLTLKQSTKASMDRIKKEIAVNQKLVRQSVRTIQRLAHEIDRYHEE